VEGLSFFSSSFVFNTARKQEIFKKRKSKNFCPNVHSKKHFVFALKIVLVKIFVLNF